MISLPVCRWRQERNEGDLLCTSAKFVNAPNIVGEELCRTCRYADHEPAARMPPGQPCLHLDSLATNGKLRRSTALPVFGCSVHGKCAVAAEDVKLPRGVRACGGCPDFLPRDLALPGSAAMRRRANAFLEKVPAYPPRRFRGRGIVLAGGGDRFFASLYVTIRALRYVGCTLPIELWYLGRNDEMPPSRQALLAPYHVTFVDADRVRRRHRARRLDGWELKIFAVLHSKFEEVLFLDADSYPCRNPEFLFDLDAYHERGAIFWPDLTPVDARLKWPAFGVEDPKRPGSVESGQFVIDKRACWEPLNLAWFYNDHSDYYYRHGYGDKHTLQVAWARCGREYVMFRPTATWHDVAYLHAGPDGRALFVHRCGGKFSLKAESFATPQRGEGMMFCPTLPLERECWSWLGELALAIGPAARANSPAPVPERIVRVGLPGHFNCSILNLDGRLLLASRKGQIGPRLFLSELGPDFQPIATRPLEIEHPSVSLGCEDPRLFLHQGRVHCAFTGLERRDHAMGIHQLVCRLDNRLLPEKAWRPSFAESAAMEKNWQFFEHRGGLYSIYSIQPHVVLRHRRGQAEMVAETAAPLPWPDHHLRGGAPPVRVGEEFYHFFHTMRQTNGHFEYALGLYTFSAEPPFAIRRAAPSLILLPDDHDVPPRLGKRVVFPCGAITDGERWIISYGYHDHECRIAVFAAAAIEGQLRPLGSE